ncbi:hypothetical protein NMV90_10445 [Pasteurella multocida]|nr:hypothetical protein [Pasteurella multocida]
MEKLKSSDRFIAELEGYALTLMQPETLANELEFLKNTFPLSLATVENKANLHNFRNGYYDLIDLLPAVFPANSLDISKNVLPYSSGFLTVLHKKLDDLRGLLADKQNNLILLPISFRDRIAFLFRFNHIPFTEILLAKN